MRQKKLPQILNLDPGSCSGDVPSSRKGPWFRVRVPVAGKCLKSGSLTQSGAVSLSDKFSFHTEKKLIFHSIPFHQLSPVLLWA